VKIRNLTQFVPLNWPFDEGSVASAGRLLTDARHRFTQAGIEVGTLGIATPPFLDVLGFPEPALLLEFAHRLETLAVKHRIDAVSIGPVVATTPLSLLLSIHALPQLITQTQKIYSGVLFASARSGINLAAARDIGQVIRQVAQATPGGRGNLRLAALANVPPHSPYIATAYQQGSRPCFALAVEAADVACDAVASARNLAEAKIRLVEAVESAANYILEIVDDLVDDHQVEFRGIDFSLTPHFGRKDGLGAAIEKLGVDKFGGSGTLFTVMFLAQAVQQTAIPHQHISGVRLPVLDDPAITQSAAEGRLSVSDLLQYAAVGSTGLDMVPLPGDTPADTIASILLDMAALAVAGNRPLSARLLPIPNAAPGDPVLPVPDSGASKLLDRNSFLSLLRPRRKN